MSVIAVESQISIFLRKYTPAVEAQLREARTRLRAMFPRGFELVYSGRLEIKRHPSSLWEVRQDRFARDVTASRHGSDYQQSLVRLIIEQGFWL